MSPTITDSPPTLRLERTYDATAAEVFAAWTDPDVLARWWAAEPTWEAAVVDVDVRPGGRYRLGMRNPDTGDVHVAGGEYLEVEAPSRIVQTFAWEGDDPRETTLTVEFNEAGGRTTVVLTHSGLASRESAESHAKGWAGCLENLATRGLAA